jgi:hypothetical protein
MITISISNGNLVYSNNGKSVNINLSGITQKTYNNSTRIVQLYVNAGESLS